MQDLSCIKALTHKLEKSVVEQDIETILLLCESHHQFLLSITLSPSDHELNLAIEKLVSAHSLAVKLIDEAHTILRKELFQSTKNRKSMSTYQGVKDAE